MLNSGGRNEPAEAFSYTLINGDFRVHKYGCKDLRKRSERGDYVAHERFSSQEQAIRSLWEDIIGDYGMTKDQPSNDWLNDHVTQATNFYPCVRLPVLEADARNNIEETPSQNPSPQGKLEVARTNEEEVMPTTTPTTPTKPCLKISTHTAHAGCPGRDLNGDLNQPKTRTDADRANDVLGGLTSAPAKATRQVRTTSRSPKPGVTNTVPKPGTRASKAEAAKAAEKVTRTADKVTRTAAKGTKATPKADPKAEVEVKVDAGTAKRSAKQALARIVLTAIADAVRDLNVADAELAGLGGPDEIAAIAAFWVHHLPTGKSEPKSPEAKRHDRWWPTTLPIPDRSDWR